LKPSDGVAAYARQSRKCASRPILRAYPCIGNCTQSSTKVSFRDEITADPDE
jgi:hypothetical protein